MHKVFFINKRQLLIIAIVISIFIHILFFFSSNILFLRKKQPTTKEPRIIEVIPYYPPKIKPVFPPDKETKSLGPKDIKTGEETKIPDIKSVPNIIEEIKPQGDIAKVSPPPKEDIVKQENTEKPLIKIEEPKKEAKKEEKKEEKKEQPSLKNLIPRSTDLLAKLPKEESINLNTGAVKGSRELILNTKEYKYWSYLEKVKRKVEAVWKYPDIARERGIGGSLKIAFTISRDGKIENNILLQSSGYSFLDDAAMKALRDASPLSPFPKEWDIEKLNIEGTFIYQINVIK